MLIINWHLTDNLQMAQNLTDKLLTDICTPHPDPLTCPLTEKELKIHT